MASDVEGLFGAVPGKVWARDICDSEVPLKRQAGGVDEAWLGCRGSLEGWLGGMDT